MKELRRVGKGRTKREMEKWESAEGRIKIEHNNT